MFVDIEIQNSNPLTDFNLLVFQIFLDNTFCFMTMVSTDLGSSKTEFDSAKGERNETNFHDIFVSEIETFLVRQQQISWKFNGQINSIPS